MSSHYLDHPRYVFEPELAGVAGLAQSHLEGRLPISVERDSLARDLLFAAASVAAISGVNVPGLRGVPLFTLFVVAVALISARSLMQLRLSSQALAPPLIFFMLIHLSFAFRISNGNGLIFVLQAVIVSLFVWAFVTRYSQVSMRRYLALTGLMMTALLVYVVGYHIAERHYTSYKLLNDAKAVFDILPVMLVVLRRSTSRTSKFLFALLLPLFVVAILLSGERKAYILLALALPFLVNFKSPLTYVAPLILIMAIPAGLALDKSGYVARQFDTLRQLASGSVATDSISDRERSFAVNYAKRIFEEHPLIGIGTNGYVAIINQQYRTGLGTHNEWMRVAAENGMLGLFFYAATVLWGFIGLFRNRVGFHLRGTDEKIVALVLFATFVIYLSFEALDFIVLMAFCFTPMVQYLRLDPNESPAGFANGRRI